MKSLVPSMVFAGCLLTQGCVEHPCPGPGKTSQEFRQDYVTCMDGRPIVNSKYNRA